MVKKIIVYPDKILRTISKDILSFDQNLHKLLDDMYDTMIEANGVGLAAIQIGVAKRVLLIDISKNEDDNKRDKNNLIEAINPKIISMQDEQICQEGCLSVPEIYIDVKRAKIVEVEYFNRYGEKIYKKVDGFLAVAWQHEIEHLNGKVFVDHMSILKRKKFEKEWRKR